MIMVASGAAATPDAEANRKANGGLRPDPALGSASSPGLFGLPALLLFRDLVGFFLVVLVRLGCQDLVREDGVRINQRRRDHEGESGLERRCLFLGEACPFDGITHVAGGRNANELAGLVVQTAFAPLITDLDGAFDKQQPG